MQYNSNDFGQPAGYGFNPSTSTYIPQQNAMYGTTVHPGPAPAPVAVKQHNPYGGVTIGTSSFSEDMTSSLNSSTADASFAYSDQTGSMVEVPTVDQGTNFMRAGKHYAPQFVSTPELLAQQGRFVELARTATGSSFIQAALREGPQNPEVGFHLEVIASELIPAIGDLMLDAHGCYVIKTVMERLAPEQLQNVVQTIAADPQLVYSMCTHSLHTRRVVQFLMDNIDVTFITEVLVERCEEVATTQQGCIIMQKAMDLTQLPATSRLLQVIYTHLLSFAVDPFANYVVQHLLEVGEREVTSKAVLTAFKNNVAFLSCNKFASNVMEKCLFHLTPAAQHELIMEMYNMTEDQLHAMLQDSFGNYIIQSSIALASFNDVFFINEKLRIVLQRTPYGHKIEARLERRLKGKPVGTRSPQIGANSKTSRRAPQQGRNARGTPSGDMSEEPW